MKLVKVDDVMMNIMHFVSTETIKLTGEFAFTRDVRARTTPMSWVNRKLNNEDE